ncbi:MAG TPA: MFS transporter [Steroidobacteraceae bacterium]|nr:MFS transporter [Steroidobacteraceae bacterium]
MGRFQIGVVVLCALAAVLDGYDLQVIGLAAPAIAHALRIPLAGMGSVFSAALAGLALGSFCLGTLSDRIGRKKVLIGATLCFGACTLGTALAGSFDTLLLTRLLTGFGLGGALPSLIALASEYTPHDRRAVVVALLWAGFPLGGMLGALLGSRLMPDPGWQWLFWIGGTAPLLIAALQTGLLPESVGYLVYSGAPAERIAALLSRVCGEKISPQARFVLGEERAASGKTGQLFRQGRGPGTLLLWVSCFVAYMQLVTNSAWSPILLSHVGVSVPQSALAMAAFNLGALIGTSAAGWLLARLGSATLLPLLLAGTVVAYGLVGYCAPGIGPIIVLESLVGLFLGAAIAALIALSALFYPAPIRSTGVGWAMGVGRIGSFLGPLIVGALLAGGWTVAAIFALLAAPALIAAFTAGLIPQRDTVVPVRTDNPGVIE